jgi:hypothetical protein
MYVFLVSLLGDGSVFHHSPEAQILQLKENSYTQKEFLFAFGLFGQYESSQLTWELLFMSQSQMDPTARGP